MYLLLQKEDIESLIDNQRSAIRLYSVFAIAIFCAGILMLLVANTIVHTDSIKTIINIGGAFVSTLSGFPVKEIVNRRDKISTYKILKRHVILIAERGDEIAPDEKNKIVDLIMEIIKSNALKL